MYKSNVIKGGGYIENTLVTYLNTKLETLFPKEGQDHLKECSKDHVKEQSTRENEVLCRQLHRVITSMLMSLQATLPFIRPKEDENDDVINDDAPNVVLDNVENGVLDIVTTKQSAIVTAYTLTMTLIRLKSSIVHIESHDASTSCE